MSKHRWLPLLVACTLASGASAGSWTSSSLPPLSRETTVAWDHYVRAVEARRAVEAGRTGEAVRRRALAGERVVQELDPMRAGERELQVPGALVHHWRGVVFIPGISADALARAIERDGPDDRPDDVLAARIVERLPDGRQRIFLRVKRSKVVTVVYDTEHLVSFSRPGQGRAASESAATRIVEIADAGTRGEHQVAPGDDHGFLWRWRAYWRYEDVPGGVLVECESLSLSRTVPALLRLVAGPIIRSTAREAMTSALGALETRYGA